MSVSHCKTIYGPHTHTAQINPHITRQHHREATEAAIAGRRGAHRANGAGLRADAARTQLGRSGSGRRVHLGDCAAAGLALEHHAGRWWALPQRHRAQRGWAHGCCHCCSGCCSLLPAAALAAARPRTRSLAPDGPCWDPCMRPAQTPKVRAGAHGHGRSLSAPCRGDGVASWRVAALIVRRHHARQDAYPRGTRRCTRCRADGGPPFLVRAVFSFNTLSVSSPRVGR